MQGALLDALRQQKQQEVPLTVRVKVVAFQAIACPQHKRDELVDVLLQILLGIGLVPAALQFNTLGS